MDSRLRGNDGMGRGNDGAVGCRIEAMLGIVGFVAACAGMMRRGVTAYECAGFRMWSKC